MNTIVIFHLITLSLYTAITFIAVSNIHYVHRAQNIPYLRMWFYIFSVTCAAQASVFTWLQVEWVINEHDADVGEEVSYAWLLFDYFNGFALLSIAMAMRVYLKWHVGHSSAEGEVHHRRSTDSHDSYHSRSA